MTETKKVEFKVVFVGDTDGGKSTFLHQYNAKEFRSVYRATIQPASTTVTAKIEEDGVEAVYRIWDTPGQDRFQSELEPGFYRNTDLGVIVFNVTSNTTFQSLDSWKDQLKFESGNRTIPLVLIGTKADMVDCRAVPAETITAWCTHNNNFVIAYHEVDNHNGDQVQKVMSEILTRVYSGYKKQIHDVTAIREELRVALSTLQETVTVLTDMLTSPTQPEEGRNVLLNELTERKSGLIDMLTELCAQLQKPQQQASSSE
eukprot:PhF_6_TR41725/c0_g1_i1/m.63309/K07897/RAB7A; Ras-related protein Rab-7A